MQQLAMVEYGGKVEKYMDTNVVMGPNGFDHMGNGVRFDLAGYKDLIC